MNACIIEIGRRKEKKLYIPHLIPQPGCLIGLFGQSGNGKTTFLEYFYRHLIHNKTNVHYLCQETVLASYLTVSETLSFYYGIGTGKRLSSLKMENILKTFVLDHVHNRHIGELDDRGLSGGERRRVALACMMCQTPPDICLFDEPFTGLDAQTTHRMLVALKETCRQHHVWMICSCHTLSFDCLSLFDEIWDVDEHGVLHIFPRDVSLPHGETLTTVKYEPSCFSKIWWLMWREVRKCRRHFFSTSAKMVLPFFTVMFQGFCLHFPFQSFQRVLESNSIVDVFEFMIVLEIIFFTVSLVPLAYITEYILDRHVVFHDVSQGYYSRRLSLVTKILLDESIMLCISIGIGVLSFPTSFTMCLLFLSNIWCLMSWTYLSVLFCLYRFRFSFSTTLFLISGYLSLSFILNLGCLLRFQNSAGTLLQHLSFQHIQTNIFLYGMYESYSYLESLVKFMSYVNIGHWFTSYLQWSIYGWSMFVILCLCVVA
jgi:energy-coupling factor transporter ATP-binding protein EcfA2